MSAQPVPEPDLPAPGPRRPASGRRPQSTGELAGQILGQAASILEEELAAGIESARGLEERFVDVDRIRSADPDLLLSRLRKDAHDIVDIAVDLLDVAVGSTGSLGRRAVAVAVRPPEGNGNAAQEEKGPHVPALVVPEPVHAGEIATTALMVENNRVTATDPIDFTCSDLVDAAGHRIGADAVTFTPRQVAVGPESAQRVTVLVTVPPDTPAGLYSGLLQGGGVEHVRAVLSLAVVRDAVPTPATTQEAPLGTSLEAPLAAPLPATEDAAGT